MASLVLGAAGAVVGSFFGPLGTSIGWALGSAIGGAMFQKGQSGPRLTDLKMHNSSFGQMIPLVYGVDRIAGNVTWETDLVEHEQKSGGKGGPTVTTYTYTASFAVHLCQGPIIGVRRIWADSRLVFDPLSGLTQENFPFTLYLGDELQLPDPTIEAHEGAGNVNANRGVAYAVFADMLLTDYGNRIPSLTFEVYTGGGPIPWRYADFLGPNNVQRAGTAGSGPVSGMLDGDRLLVSSVPGEYGTYWIAQPNGFQIDAYDLAGNFLETVLTAQMQTPGGGSTTHSQILHCLNNVHIMSALHGPKFTGDPNINAFYYDGIITQLGIAAPGGSLDGGVDQYYAISSASIFGNEAVYGCGGNSVAYIAKWPAPGGAVTTAFPIASSSLPVTPGVRWIPALDTATGDIWCVGAAISSGASVFRFDKDLNSLHSWQWSDFPGLTALLPGVGSGGFTVWNKFISFSNASSSVHTCVTYSINDDNTFTLQSPGSVATGLSPVPYIGNMISLGNGLIYTADGLVSLVQQPSAVTLASIVSDLSVRSGLVTSQIDVTDLTDLVDGYVVSTQGPTRSMIEPLQTAYFFDAVESDTQAKFVKRGRDSQASVPDSDLGAFVSGSTPPPIVTVARAQEVDLPRIISCVYVNKNTDYLNGTQISQRLITSSELSVSLQLAIVMSDKKAKEITDALLFNGWLERDKVTALVPRKWTYLEPTDVITVHGYRIRVTDKAETVPGVIKLEGVATAPFVFSQDAGLAVPGLAPPPQPPTQAVPTTEMLLLDIPLVVDTDYPNGYYAALAGATGGAWPGATIFKSTDGGVNYSSLVADVVPDSIGVSTTALGPFLGGNIFDETNSVTVQLDPGAGALESHSEIEVLNGANEALLGNELLQYKTATLVGTRLYTLTGMLRGRRGTEWAMTHPIGDRFVVLPTSTNINGPFPEVFAERQFKAVTSGGSLAAATAQAFTNNGAALRCYSPVQIGGALNAAGDLTITWLRRTRIGGTWQNFVDVPLSESTEAYVVQIWDATFTVCARVITGVTSPSVTYTAADQVTDFGATQSSIFVTVGQLGTIGLGVQQSAILLGAGGSISAPLSPVTPYGSGPPSGSPTGGCSGTVFNTTLTFALGDSGLILSPAGLGPGSTWVLKLTTPGSGNYIGRFDFFEYAGPTNTKTILLSTGPCGAPLMDHAYQTGAGPIEMGFVVGRNDYPWIYPTLAYGTDYYFSLTQPALGGSAVEMIIAAN